MKKLFVFLFISFVAFSASANWAVDSLNSARKEDAIVVSKISTERNEISQRIKNLSDKIKKADEEFRELEAKKSDSLAMSDKSKYYDSLMEKFLALASQNFSSDISNLLTLSDASDFISAEIGKLQSRLFNSLKSEKATVKRIKTDNELSGEIFKVGAFSYFVGKDTAGFVSDGVLYLEDFSKEISDFYNEKTNTIPADVSGGVLFEKIKKSRSIAEEISLGGVWMYPILFFGLLSICVCIFKIFLFAFIRRASSNTINRIFVALQNDDISSAEKIAISSGYPYSSLLSELIKSRNLNSSLLEEISYEQMLSAGERLFGGLSVLSVSAAVAPLFGLLGTVTGIIKTFGDLSMRSAEQAQFISAGISEALITTEYGLIVAIPAFVAHAILSRRAKGVLSDMEKLSSSFLAANRK